MRLLRTSVAILAVGLLPLLGAAVGSTGISLARFTDSASPRQSLSTDTLAPPTSLGATGGTSVALTWTATVDTYAAGYDVMRGTANGGPYSVVSSVSPRTVVTTTDGPGTSGTYYYVLRSTFQNWRSVYSNQATAIVGLAPISTGFRACTGTSNAADTGGDGNGYQTNPANACVSGGGVASDTDTGTDTTLSCANTGKDRHRYWDFTLGVPGSVAAITGIQVRADLGMNNNAGTSWICAELSWDAGATWTAAKSTPLSGPGVSQYDLGGTADTWGRTWSAAEFSNANFRVRLTDVSDRTNKTFRLDFLSIQVTYTP